jgi:hypothetical protein
LGVEAGAAFNEGREGRETFGETLAVDQGDRERLGSTILLQARKHDRPMPFVAPAWARQFTKHDLRLRLYATPGEEEPTHEYGYWWAEWGGTLDTIKDNETIRDELLAIALGIWDHIKHGPPENRDADAAADPFGASHWALEWIGFLPGKRESRRFIGQHVLCEQDVLESREFSDAIAYGGWSLDLHPPGGIDTSDQPPCQQHPVPFLYDIPLRCCVARDVSNLMFAGRNLSATHVAFSSTRVMATCAVVGQGVGTAAAYAVRHDEPVCDLATNESAMQAIGERLLRDDGFLIGRPNSDRDDVARLARVTASSEVAGGEAKNVVSGLSRAVHGKCGAPPSRRVAGTQRWMSEPSAGLPAWLQLEWEHAVTVTEVQLIFDTGLHRHLTLSHHDGYSRSMQWGQPQAETVRDYELEFYDETGSKTTVKVTGNHQRRRRHPASLPHPIKRLRIKVTRTNGLDHARIVEVRGYGNDSIWKI